MVKMAGIVFSITILTILTIQPFLIFLFVFLNASTIPVQLLVSHQLS